MPEHDSLNGLADELRALPAQHRRIVMKALTGAERSRVASLLTPPKVNPKEPDSNPNEQLVEGYSALIGGRIRSAQSESAPSQKSWRMTPAARRQLLLSAQEIQESSRAEEQEKVRPRGRSLLNALGAWLASGASSR